MINQQSSSYVAAGCKTAVGVPLAAGVVLEVHRTLLPDALSDRVYFAAGPFLVTISVHGDNRIVTRSGVQIVDNRPYDPASMTWWQLKATSATTITASVSPDGIEWTTLGDATVPDATAPLDVGFGVQPTDATITLVLESFNCPTIP